jgi:peptidoglycan-associated lipoprotein
MKQQLQRSLIACLMTAVCCAGCTKHELVKQDQMIPSVSPAASAQPAKAALINQVKPASKNDALAQSSIKESSAAQTAAQNAPAKDAKDGALQAKLDKIFFDFDSPTLSPAARATLAKDAEILKQQGNSKIRIEGNCDELGSDDYNLSLGESRAKSAMKYLQSLGIKSDRLSVISYGKEKPADSGHDESARARNRRDEFLITSN